MDIAKRRDFDQPVRYRIQVQGQLGEHWSDWFSGLTITCDPECDVSPVTTLTGVVDQAALRGILTRVWDLNLVVISIAPIEDET